MNAKKLLRPRRLLSLAGILIGSLLLAFVLELYSIIPSKISALKGFRDIPGLIQYFNAAHTAVFFCFFMLSGLFIYFFGKRFLPLLYRFRWPIGILIITAAVVFEINGSSIGLWQQHFSDPAVTSDGVLFGINRPVRSDEWAVHTPLTFAQYYSDFSVFNEVLHGGGSTDMYMVYGQPVLDWSILFRPFQIGYLFLSPARGLSFYWACKVIFLFLVSFELGMLLTKKNKALSVVYAVMMLFAPAVQWWFGTVFFPEILIYGQAVVLLAAGYMHAKKYSVRFLCALGFVLCGGAYLLSIYPAWQVPFFYVFAALIVWLIFEKRKECMFCLRKDLPIILGSFLLLGIAVGAILLRSMDTIKAVSGSVYPGSRMETGGDAGAGIFLRYPGNLFLPFTLYQLPSNQSEMSAFFDLFPMGILLSLLVFFKEKTKDKLLLILFIVQLFLSTYVLLGFPAMLSKLTLLNNSQAVRAFMAVGFINILLLIRSLALAKDNRKVYIALPLSAVLAAVTAYGSKRFQYGEYLNTLFLLVTAAILFVLFASALLYRRKYMNRVFCISICLVMLLAGAFINPIRKGTKFLEENRLARAVQQIQKEDGGLWLAADSDLFCDGNFLAMNGAPAVNATHTYPDFTLWHALDDEGAFEDIYNRYAHVLVDIVIEEPTTFVLIQPDVVKIRLNVEDISLLKVDYILSPADLTALNSPECSFTLLFSEESISRKIYKVN